MKKIIYLTDSIYEIVKKHDGVIEVMESLGFEGMTNKITIGTVGKIMTLKKGAKFKKLDIQKVIEEFEKKGFIVKE
ncbi:MAG: DUF1858 domain-containing protein [Candidatus Izimaplasma sp.]|nr:DUF1858 domain-containing protein [Candidatus Izimaplasma bacterium]